MRGLASLAHVREAMGQPSNAQLPKLVTLAGMLMDVNPLQPSNAQSPMLVTPIGMLMDVNPLQPLNAYFPMLVTLEGMIRFFTSFPAI